MTYAEFKKWVAERGLTLSQLRADDAPPSEEVYDLMCGIGLGVYERYVVRFQKEQR